MIEGAGGVEVPKALFYVPGGVVFMTSGVVGLLGCS